METSNTQSKIDHIHDEYIAKVASLLPEKDKEMAPHNKIDRLMLHVIEELVEMRRNYPRKFWKQSKEALNKDELIEEAADVYLMVRSMYLEVCNTTGITYEEFLQHTLKKAQKNQRRINSGY